MFLYSILKPLIVLVVFIWFMISLMKFIAPFIGITLLFLMIYLIARPHIKNRKNLNNINFNKTEGNSYKNYQVNSNSSEKNIEQERAANSSKKSFVPKRTSLKTPNLSREIVSVPKEWSK